MSRPPSARAPWTAAAAGAAAVGTALSCAPWVVQHAWLVEKHGPLGYAARLGGLVLAAAALGVLALAAWRGRPGARASGASARWTFAALVAAWAAYLALNPELRRRELAAFSAYALGLVALGHLAAGRAGTWSGARRRAARGLELLAFTLAATLVGGELALRAWGYLAPRPLLAQDFVDYSAWVENERRPPGWVHFGFPCNAHGNYDTDVPDEPRRDPLVVSIGDSFSLGVVPHAFHFTTVAERELGRGEVYNVGVPGAGPPHYLYLLHTQALPLAPDAIVVHLFLGNDVTAPGQPPARLSGLETWFTRDKLMLLAVPERLARLRAARRASGDPARPAGAVVEPGVPARRLETVAECLAEYPYLADPLLEEPTFRPAGAFLAIERKRAREACGPEADYEGILDSLDRLVAAAGDTPFGFVLIPDEFQVDDELWRDVSAGRGAFERFKPQRVVGEWCARRGVPVLDLLPVLRSQEPLADGRPHLYHLRDTHFNARGNEVAGRSLAGFVEELLAARRPR